MVTIKTSDMFAVMQAAFTANQTVAPSERTWPCFIGPSGAGKTQIVGQFTQAIDYDLVPVHLLSMTAEDAKFPIVDPVLGEVKWVPATQFLAGKRPKLFFWDELDHASTMIQSLCYAVFEGNRIGDFRLPDDCMHVAAHNRVADKGVHNRRPMPLRRRWYELNVEIDFEGWCKWAVKADLDPGVLGFIRWRPEMLYQDSVQDALAPDPRAWAKLSALIKANPGLPQHIMHAMTCGKVGEGTGHEFTAYQRMRADLPSLDFILLNPDKADIPSNPSALYAIASGLARKMTVTSIGRALRYLARIEKETEFGSEFGILAVRDAVLLNKTLQSTPELTKWAIQNSDVIL